MPPRRKTDDREPEEKARDSAMAMLARREHAVRELQTKLLSKGHGRNTVDLVMSKLVEDRLISDQRYAEALVYSRRNGGYGPVRIAYELREKGVDDGIVEEYLDFNDHRWIEELERVRTLKYGETRPSSYQDWAKRANFLSGRGFTSDQVRLVLGEFGKNF